MKAWRISEAGDILLEDLPSQPVSEGCIKIKIMCSTLSLSDRLICQGEMSATQKPLIIGRQGVGMVTEVGDGVKGISRGDRVAVDSVISCQTCSSCKAGKINECEKMLTYGVDEDGLLRDFAVVSENEVYKLPERVKDSEAVFLEHISLAINALSKLQLEKGEHIVIAGASVVGIIVAQLAIYQQAVPIIVDTRSDRLAVAEDLGVYYTINSVDTDVQKKIFSLTGGKMAESVVHITTGQLPVARSLEYVRRGGKVVLCGFGGVERETTVSLAPVLSKQLTLIGVNNGAKSFSSAINMLANKTVSVAPLISTEIPFQSVGDTLKEICENPTKYLKVIVKMS